MGVGDYNERYGYDANTGNLTSKGGQTISYSPLGRPHAATSMGANSYGYDANGNMTSRTVGGVSYALTYDQESRLAGVYGGTTNETYTYDGDGARVKVVNGYTTTVYIGDYYEYTVVDEPVLPVPTVDPTGGGEGAPTGGTLPPTVTMRSYYYAGSQRLAVRDSATGVAYLYGDHLGSASVAVSGNSTVLSRTRYKAWGEQRGQSGSAFPTDRLFTGQIWDGAESAGGTGLYFYNARYYDPLLARFIQADTIVPNPANPQSFNRYAYVLNNPLKYTDPSGHCEVEYQQGSPEYQRCSDNRDEVESEFGIILGDRALWTLDTLLTLYDSLSAFRDAIGRKVYYRYILGNGLNKPTVLFTSRHPFYDEGTHYIYLNIVFDPRSYESHIQVIHEFTHALIYQMYRKKESADPASLRYAKDMKWLPVGDAWLVHRTNSTAYGRDEKSPEEDLAEAVAIYVWDTRNGNPPALSIAQRGWVGSFLWTLRSGTQRWWEVPKAGIKR